jgi:acetate kinase
MAPRNKLMVINAGSSSLKFKLFQMGGAAAEGLRVVASGICERVGDPAASFLRAKVGEGEESRSEQPLPTHTSALEAVSSFLSHALKGVRA